MKSKERIKRTGEVFTPPELTNEILDKMPQEIWEPSKTFCDPACGNGNMLLEVFKRKLLQDHAPLLALSTIYGVDLMPDNIEEMKSRFLEMIPKELHKEAMKIMNKQFICHDALTWDFIRWKEKTTHKKMF